MKFILGTKEKMTQYFAEDGRAYGATLIKAGPIVVTQIKDDGKDGYCAVQVGFGSRRTVGKALTGHFLAAGKANDSKNLFRHVKEYRLWNEDEKADVAMGDTIKADVFAPGDTVVVSGISKGKGFQGVVKRHGFGGGRRSHGQKHSEREPGSIGGGLRARVPKGMRMAGRMGSDRSTVKNLKVLAVNADTNEILIAGAVPGRRGTLIEIRG